MAACVKTYRQSADVVDSCPNDPDLLLFVNDANLAVFRTWEKIKECLSVSGALPPLIGVTGDGGANDPVEDSSFFQSADLVGLGSTNNGRIMIFIDNIPQTNFGSNPSFIFDNSLGLIDISPNSFPLGSGLYVDRNQ